MVIALRNAGLVLGCCVVLISTGCTKNGSGGKPAPQVGSTRQEQAPRSPAQPSPLEPDPVPATQPAAKPAAGATSTLELKGVSFSVDPSWTKRAPSSSMRLAEYTLPSDQGMCDLTAFWFGPGQGGSTEANVDRWVRQFNNPADPSKPAEPQKETFQNDTLSVTVVRISGTYAPGAMGPNAPAPSPQPGYAMVGIVVEGWPEGPLFIKATGPEAAIANLHPVLDAFARSVRRGP